MGADLGAHSARTCSRRLSPARLGTVLTWLGRIPADRRVPETFLGVKGSPVQIRPSRLFFEHLYPEMGTKTAMIIPT